MTSNLIFNQLLSDHKQLSRIKNSVSHLRKISRIKNSLSIFENESRGEQYTIWKKLLRTNITSCIFCKKQEIKFMLLSSSLASVQHSSLASTINPS